MACIAARFGLPLMSGTPGAELARKGVEPTSMLPSAAAQGLGLLLHAQACIRIVC